MILLGLAARVVLAIVFLASASSKLRTRSAFADFRTSLIAMLGLTHPRKRQLVAVMVVLLEVLVAAFMIVPQQMVFRLGCLSASFLLLAFSLVLARTLRTGLQVACHCFGASSTAIVSSHDIARNLLLAAFALAVGVIAPAPAIPTALATLPVGTAAVLAAWAAIHLDDITWLGGLE